METLASSYAEHTVLGEGHETKACEKVFQYLMKSIQCLIRDIVTDCFRGKLHGMVHTRDHCYLIGKRNLPWFSIQTSKTRFFLLR